jgi:hypothetical protein
MRIIIVINFLPVRYGDVQRKQSTPSFTGRKKRDGRQHAKGGGATCKGGGDNMQRGRGEGADNMQRWGQTTCKGAFIYGLSSD